MLYDKDGNEVDLNSLMAQLLKDNLTVDVCVDNKLNFPNENYTEIEVTLNYNGTEISKHSDTI